MSAISSTLIRRLSSTIWLILAMFSSLVAVFGRPERSLSPKVLRPRLNSAAQNFTEVNDGAEFPYTKSNSSLICVGVLSFKNKYLMTARYSILSPTHSNDCYITTARPKWLKLWWVTVNRWTTKFTSFYLRVLLVNFSDHPFIYKYNIPLWRGTERLNLLRRRARNHFLLTNSLILSSKYPFQGLKFRSL